jgi:hypothetical protein
MKKNAVIVLLFIPFLFACGNRKEKQAEEKIYSVERLQENIEALVDSTVMIEGEVVHVCRHNGKKLFVIGEKPENSFKIFAEDEKFDVNLEGKFAIIKGIVEEFRVDQVYVDKLRAEILASIEADSLAALEGEEHANNHTHGELMSDDSSPIDHHADYMQQVDDFQEQIDKSKKGYISFYSIRMISIEEKKIETEETETTEE